MDSRLFGLSLFIRCSRAACKARLARSHIGALFANEPIPFHVFPVTSGPKKEFRSSSLTPQALEAVLRADVMF